MVPEASLRGFLGSALDRCAAWYIGLPAETCNYTVTHHVAIPMQDGVDLIADLYQPKVSATEAASSSASSPPMLLVQGCYGRGLAMSLINARLYAARGYLVLFVSCRGTFGSGGAFQPGRDEQRDSQDIVGWMRRQAWYPGSFATAGSSYLGYAQWALLHDPPADWVGAGVPAAAHDYADNHWGSGALRLDRITWSDTVAHQEDGDGARMRARLLPPSGRLAKDKALAHAVFTGLPLHHGLHTYLAGSAPWVADVLAHPDPDDAYWEPTRHAAALERVDKPVFLASGWHDLFAAQTMHQYARLRDRGCPVALTVGPWSHYGAAGLEPLPDMLQFLDEHVAGRKGNRRRDPVRVYVMGADEWRSMPSWPPSTKPRVWYLQGDKTLKTEASLTDATPSSSSFTFDPSSPSPTIGGPLLAGGGRVNDSAYASRSDMLVYTSSRLEADVEILGRPAVEMTHSSDTPYVDLWVRLSEVDRAGVSHNITESFQALDPKRDGATPIRVEMRDCAHRFRKGMRIRLIVAGGSFPQYARSLGAEGNRVMGSIAKPACHTIRYSSGGSKLILPTAA
ncbi:hypothetical protein AK830_g10611 [Neonectria ditissima]|uniref:Xaa-Pro dipeptidyl-peptidase C-terminal domain-containing protein n=1 Tax=Neonectria ditissima TaxID=78410 RepID=A0A0P7B635_9HYPO|nr:hypothetical protein AK830_g10611 [Neonectria ditissima]